MLSELIVSVIFIFKKSNHSTSDALDVISISSSVGLCHTLRLTESDTLRRADRLTKDMR